MGEWVKPRTFRLSDDAMRKVHEIEDAFSPVAENATDALRIMIDLFHSKLFGGGIVERVAGALQCLHRNTSYDRAPLAAAPEGKAPILGAQPGPVREVSLAGDSRRVSNGPMEFRRVQRRAKVESATSLYAYRPTSFRGIRLLQVGA
jgi:hypothetical protein